VARAALTDVIECAMFAAKDDGERAVDYFETLLEAQQLMDGDTAG
jgi:hypothetical protein